MKTAVCCNQSSFDQGHVCFGFGAPTKSTESPTDSPSPASPNLHDPVTERILMALTGANAGVAIANVDRAESMVPHSGKADSMRAVFIKSSTSDEKLATIIEESLTAYTPNESISIVKSAPIEERDLTMAASLATFTPPSPQVTASAAVPIKPDVSAATTTTATPIKTPQGVRKFQFHGLFSFFYNRSEESTNGTSNGSMGEVTSEESTMMEVDSDGIEEQAIDWNVDLKKQPAKSILKPAKEVGDLSSLPPPVQKSVFLRQEEIYRMTRFNHALRSRNHHLAHSRESHIPAHTTHEHTNHHESNTSSLLKSRGVSSMPQLNGGRRLQFTLERSTVHETWHRSDYERGGVEYIAKSLTPEIANLIKKELNEVKREMEVHQDSRHFTQFYPVR